MMGGTLPGFQVAKAEELTLDLGDPKGEWLDLVEPFLKAIATDDNGKFRKFQVDAVIAALKALDPEAPRDSIDGWVERSHNRNNALKSFYGGSTDKHVSLCNFPGKRSGTLDLATAAGKSYIMYAVARCALYLGWVDQVLVICPGLVIEEGLREKFNYLNNRVDLTATLTQKEGLGTHVPDVMRDASSTILPGSICIENVAAVYEDSSSSVHSSLKGEAGKRTLVLNDEAHHVYPSGGPKDAGTIWHAFCASTDYNFYAVLGFSATCYRPGNSSEFPYFADVIYRYAIRDALNDGFVKNVLYGKQVEGQLNLTLDTQFEALWVAHNKAKEELDSTGVKPLALVVSSNQREMESCAKKFTTWAKTNKGVDVESKTILVASEEKYREGRAALRYVDSASSPVEFIFSVSMLTEGWDSKNVFTILPSEERAFNSHLLISQVLGRGLRIPVASKPAADWNLRVINHVNWSDGIEALVDSVVERSSVISRAPLRQTPSAHHFRLAFVSGSSRRVTSNELKPAAAFNAGLLDNYMNLTHQDTSEQALRMYKVSDRSQSAETLRVAESHYSGWKTIPEVARYVRSAMRNAFKGQQDFRDTVLSEMTLERLGQFIYRSIGKQMPIPEGTPTSEIRISPENTQKVLEFIANEVFPPQGELFVEEVKVEHSLVLERTHTEDMPQSQWRVSNVIDSKIFTSEEALKEYEDLRPTEYATLTGSGLDISKSPKYRCPMGLTITSFNTERRFIEDVLLKAGETLASWVKNPDGGFWYLPYEVTTGVDAGARKNFNPDFLLLEKRPEEGEFIRVVEIKWDGEDEAITKDKVRDAAVAIRELNRQLDKIKDTGPRYTFHLLTPKDYSAFLGHLDSGTLDSSGFTGEVHGRMLGG